jgi:putative peptidoglycan lipid II flippase
LLEPDLKADSKKVLSAAGAIGFATLLSRIFGLVREQVFAYLFGAGNFTDAFNVAFRIPSLLRSLFAEGAMSAALIPTFTRVRIEEGDDRAWRVAGLVFRVLFVSATLLAALGLIFAPTLVSFYASAFKQIPNKFELTVRMTRIMIPYFPMVALAAAFMGILNACEVFFLPALSSALFNVASISVGVFFAVFVFQRHPSWGFFPVEGMAIGVLAGGLVQALCQLPRLYQVGYRWPKSVARAPSWKEDPALRRMLVLIAPGIAGLAATQISILVNTFLATSQGPGAVSWLNYAFRLMQFPIGIFGASLASATLPLVAEKWVNRDFSAARDTLLSSLRKTFAVNLPASVGLACLGSPVIALIFQYGRFTSEDTRATALALAMYAFGLTAYSAVKILVPACYAMGNTRAPVLSSVISVTVAVILNFLLIRPLGYWGLALGTSVGAWVNLVILFVAVGQIFKAHEVEISSKFVWRPLLTHLAIALMMGIVCSFSYRGLNLGLPEADWARSLGKKYIVLLRLIKVGGVMAEGIGAVLLLEKVFGVNETSEVLDLFVKKLKKKLSPRTT